MRSRLLLSTVALLAAVLAPAVSAEPPADLADKLNAHGGQPLPIEAIDDSPVPGLYEVRLRGGNTLYSDAEGQYLIVGDLYQNAEDGMVNLTEQAANQRRKALVDAVPENDRVATSTASANPGDDADARRKTPSHVAASHFDPGLEPHAPMVRSGARDRVGENGAARETPTEMRSRFGARWPRINRD